MKSTRLLLVAAALSLCAGPLAAEEIGAFFTRVNAYIYAQGPNAGKRFLIRPRQAYTVTDVAMDNSERLWLQIVYLKQSRTFSGEGWTPLAPHEIMGAGPKPMEIFSTTLENPATGINSLRVPATDLKLLNVTQRSTRFPEITWQKVAYETKKPLRPWVRATTGIFRPGKTREFVSQVYAEMVSRALNKEKLKRLLSGVVRVGDTVLEVRWALGKPLRVVEEAIANAERTVWHYPTLAVRFENQLVEQIN